MKLIFIFTSVALLLSGCSNCSRNTETTTSEVQTEVAVGSDMHTAQISLDYEGVYKGVIPNSEGVDHTMVVILSGETFYKKTLLGEEETLEKGTYVWEEDGATILLQGAPIPNRFFVAENRLFVYDEQGYRMRNADGELYALDKQFEEQAEK